MSKLLRFLDEMFPRFMTEDVALVMNEDGSGWEIVCSVIDIQEGEEFEAFATMRFFNLFGVALFPEMVGEIRYEQHDNNVPS